MNPSKTSLLNHSPKPKVIRHFFGVCLYVLLLVAFICHNASGQTTLGGVNLGKLPDYLFVFTNGNVDANWQGATKGFIGDVAINGVLASERTSGGVPYAGTIYTNDATLSSWQNIVNQNAAPAVSPSQAFASTNETTRISNLVNDLNSAFSQINALAPSTGYGSVSSGSLDGLNTQNGIPQTFVINVTSGLSTSATISITGDAGDVFILRWDSDGNPANGYQGQVKFQSGGGIIPLGGLKATNFIHVAGDLNCSGGGSTPAAPYPQGPRSNDGTGSLINNGSDFNGGGFFTGYWLTTGDPSNGETSPFSNGIFVGGWYSSTTKFSMTSGTSGVYVTPPVPPNLLPIAVNDSTTTPVNTPVSINICTNDTPSGDGGNVWTGITQPTNGTITFSPPCTFIYTPDSDYVGTDSFLYVLCDVNGDCDTALVYITILCVNPPAPTLVVSQPLCSSSTGTISVQVPTGAGITYSINGISYQSSTVFSGLSAGTYHVTAKSSAGCESTSTTAVVNSPPAALAANANAGSIQCFGGSTSVTVSGTGGTAPYTGTGSFTRTAGTFTFTITDANGCTAQTNITINQPTLLAAASAVASPILCFGGSTTVNVTGNGGTAPYTGTGSFTRTAGTYTFTITDANGCTAQTIITVTEPTQLSASSGSGAILCFGGSTTVTVSGSGGTAPYTGTGSFTRTAGTYTFTITDANGCTAQTGITVTQPTQLSASSGSGAIQCFGGSTTVTVSGSGGTAPYTGTGSFTRTAGTYTFTITDANGCTAQTSITISQPDQLIAASSIASPILCFGGSTSVNVTASGGTPSFTGTGSFTRTAGTFNFTVTDANGCTAQTGITITQPTALSGTATAGPASCNGGSNGTATISPSGGTAPYTYLWSNGATTQTATGLPSGTYTVTVTDANGCSITRNTNLSQPTQLTANATSGSILCFGGSTTVAVSGSGGTTPYSGIGNFTRTAGTFSFTITDANGCTAQTSISISQPDQLIAASSIASPILCFGGSTSVNVTATGGTPSFTGTGSFTRTAGTFNFTVTDANGCTAQTSVTITQPPALTGTTSTTPVTCNGGSDGTCTISAGGGTPPYAYLWSSGATNVTASGLPAGTYTVTVTDANGCTIIRTATISEPAPVPAPTLNISQPTCSTSTGSIAVTSPTGAGFTYNINGGVFQSGTLFSGLAAGSYAVIAKNAAGCQSNPTNATLVPSAGCDSAGLYPTATSCSTFKSGATRLTEVCYTVRRNKVSNATPGVFFYYSYITAPAANFTLDIIQTCATPGFNLFNVVTSTNGSQVFFWRPNCTRLATGTQIAPGQARVNVTNAIPGQVYVISVKYDSKSIIGSTPSFPGQVASYSFRATVNGSPASGSSTNLLVKSTNCVPLRYEFDENEKWPRIKTYPNPTASDVNMNYTMLTPGQVEFSVYDINGALVMQKPVQHEDEGEYEITLPFSEAKVSPGLYFVRVVRNSDVETIRIVYTQ